MSSKTKWNRVPPPPKTACLRNSISRLFRPRGVYLMVNTENLANRTQYRFPILFLPLYRDLRRKASEGLWAINLVKAANLSGYPCTIVIGETTEEIAGELQFATIHHLGVGAEYDLISEFRFYLLLLLKGFILARRNTIVHHAFPLGYGLGFNPFIFFLRRKHFVLGPLLYPSNDPPNTLKLLGYSNSIPHQFRVFRRLLWKLHICTLSRAEHVIFESEFARDIYSALYEKIRDKPYTILGTGGLPEWEPSQLGLRRDEEKVNRIAVVTNLIQRKRVDIVIQALHQLESQDTELLVIGAGPEEKKLRNLVSEFEMDGRIRFLGPLVFNQIQSILSDIDVLVSMDDYPQTYTPSLQEGMMAGTIVIKALSPPFLNTDKKRIAGGYLIKQDAIILSQIIRELQADASLVRLLKREARDFARNNFTLEAVAHKLQSIYTSLEPERDRKLP